MCHVHESRYEVIVNAMVNAGPEVNISLRDSSTITGVRFYKLDIASIKNINVSLKWN